MRLWAGLVCCVSCLFAQDVLELHGTRTGWVQNAPTLAVGEHETNRAEGRVHAVSAVDPSQLAFAYGEDGEATLLFQVEAASAAAIRLHFEDVHLPEHARLYVYGLANGMVTRLAGPFTAAGPLGSGEFWTEAIPGSRVAVELQLRAGIATLPFRLTELAVVDGREESVSGAESFPRGPRRVSYYRGVPVEHAVVDGYGVIEGDILIGRSEELVEYRGGKTDPRQATIVNYPMYLWPGGKIPYVIDPGLPAVERVTDSIAHWNTKLAGHLQLVPRTNESSYISFIRAASASTCSSYVGTANMAAQPVNIGDACSTGNIIHEIGHTVGLYHEHTRTDRDTYIRVLMDNIQSSAKYNFYVAPLSAAQGPYDYNSIMHYSAYAFSGNGQPTIETIPAGIPIGQRDGLSDGDVAGVKALYPAASAPPPPPVPTPVSVTLSANMAGRTLVVDGANVTAPVTLQWLPGSTHTVSAPDAVVNNVKYVFSSWSDGGAQTHTVTVPAAAFTLSATFATKFQLRAVPSSTSQGSVSVSPAASDGFYSQFSTVSVHATPQSGSCFAGWTGVLPVKDASISVTVNQPYEITANFQPGAVTVPARVDLDAGGGMYDVSLAANSSCIWNVTGGASWLSATVRTGQGSTVLRVKYSRNAGGGRSAVLLINGNPVVFEQAGR